MDLQDSRTNSFQHILDILPEIQFKYLVLENVQGFETSDARNQLVKTLERCSFQWQEYLTSPADVGIPNSRLRYYMIAKAQNLGSPFESPPTIQSLKGIPSLKDSNKIRTCETSYASLLKAELGIWRSRRQKVLMSDDYKNVSDEDPPCVADILEPDAGDETVVSPSLREKYEQAMDIVAPNSANTCCFTKSYGHYVKGTGSVLSCVDGNGLKKLRFFTPREVLRLMCYSDSFQFPNDASVKQQYKALGNSLNPYVVAILITLLIS